MDRHLATVFIALFVLGAGCTDDGYSSASSDANNGANNGQTGCGDGCGDNATCTEGECACLPGFEPGAEGCADIDECATDNGGCSDECVNAEGGFECACGPGSTLGDDGLNCESEGPCPGCTLCNDTASIDAQIEATRAHYEVLTADLPAQPIAQELPEDTNGTLVLDVHPHAFPVLSSDEGVFVAATQLGEGRIVAFSGQDFLSSQTRSTLLDEPGVAGLITNATQWAAQGNGLGDIEVLAANDVVAELVRDAGGTARVAAIRRSEGLEEIRDWSAEALEGADVAIVQVNEWGTLHLSATDVPVLRNFVESGGGLLIAGSALHWSWWLHWTSDTNQGDAILEGTGISWAANGVRAVQEARFAYDPYDVPIALWCAYVQGQDVEDRLLSRLTPLFLAAREDGRRVELDRALERMVDETPSLPVQRGVAPALLSADVGAMLPGHDWPAPHPWAAVFPGSVDDSAERVTATVTIDARYKRARPLGFYAPPGASIGIEVDPAHVGMGLGIRVGELHDDNRFLGHIDPWQRAPLLVQDTAVDAVEILVGNGLGGSLYLLVPEDYPDADVSVTVGGAVRQPLYDHGVTEPAAFEASLDAGVPRVILQEVGKVRMVVGVEAARQVEDPGAVMDFWTGFLDSHSRLGQEPAPRPYESHWIFDIQVGWGYANATPHRLNFPPNSEVWALRTRTGDEDWWLFAHELGHQWQTPDWAGGDITEVAVNLFSMYTINEYLNDGGAFETRGFKDNRIDHGALRDSRWATADVFGKLELYRQLVFEFGWPVFEAVFGSYYDSEYSRDVYGGFMDGFALRFSAVSGQDITPFLVHWEYPLTEGARAVIQGFGLPEWLPPGW